MTRLIAPVRFAVLLSALAAVGCQNPTDPTDTIRFDEAVDIAANPDPITADDQTGGRTYRIVRGNNQPDDILAYDWHTVFSANISLNANADDDDLDIDYPGPRRRHHADHQAGDRRHRDAAERQRQREVRVRHARAPAATSSTRINTPITLSFEAWYDLPSLRKEAIVQVSASFVDDDGSAFQKVVDIKVAP